MYKNKNLSILFFSHSSELGGAEKSLGDLIEGMIKRGTTCSVIVPGDGPLIKKFKEIGANVYKTTLNYSWWAFNGKSKIDERNLSIFGSFQKLESEILPIVKSIDPDIIYTQTIVIPWGAICACKINVPHVLSVREYGELDHGLEFPLGFKESMKALYKDSSIIFSNTDDVKNTVFSEFKNDLNFNKKCITVGSSVKIPDELLKKYLLNNSRRLNKNKNTNLLILGTICKGKGQLEAVKAVRELNNLNYKVKLELIGYPTEIEYLKKIKKEIANNNLESLVKIRSFTETPYENIAKSDILLSCSRSEALGRTIFEAVLLKKPFIYSDSGGSREVFKSMVHGLSYKPGDYKDLTKKIIYTIDFPEQTNERIKNASEYVEKKFNDTSYIEKQLLIMRDLFSEKILFKKTCFTENLLNRMDYKNLIKYTKLLLETQKDSLRKKDEETTKINQKIDKIIEEEKKKINEYEEKLRKKKKNIENLTEKYEKIVDRYEKVKNQNERMKGLAEMIKRKNEELAKNKKEIDEYSFALLQRNQEIKEIRNSIRWKAPNYLYKLYKNKTERHIPKFIFNVKDKTITLSTNAHKELSRTVGPSLKLFRLAFQEFQMTGWDGLKFAVDRHLKKRRGELFCNYPIANDYIENLISIAILTKDRIDLIKPCIESIQKYPSKKYKFTILIGDTGTTDKEVLKYYEQIRKKYRNIRIINFKKYFFSKNYNDLINHAKGQFLVFLNNDTIVKEGWLDNLVDPLKDKKIGIVGGKLLYKDGKIQHAGIKFKTDGNSFHPFKNYMPDFPKINFPAIVPAVTLACVSIRHDVFDRFKLNEEYKEEAQDTDFCLRLTEAGYDILYNPKVEIFHLECSTRDWRKGEKDRILLSKQWGKKIRKIASKGEQRDRYDFNRYRNAIVVLRDDGMGDLLMGVSAFSNLRKKYPKKKLILATYERNIEMMRGFSIFDEFIPIPNGQKYAPFPIPTIGTKIYNLINLEMDFKVASSKSKEENKLPRQISFARAIRVNEKYDSVPMPNFSNEKERMLKLIKNLNKEKNNNFVVLNLLATNPARSWWEPYYPSLIQAIEKMGFIPVIVGTKNNVFFKGKKVINLAEKTKTITEYIEVIKLGKYVISTDTSAYHVAALSGIPFVAIFTGGVRPESRLQFYSKYEALEPVGLKCHPCWDEGCKDLSIRWKKDPCRLIIKPEEVIEKFKKLVKKYPR